MSIAIDRAALEAARNRPVIVSKFIANALPTIVSVGTAAAQGFTNPVADAAALGTVVGDFSGGAQLPNGGNPLTSVIGALGPAAASNAIARNNWGQAQQIMTGALDQVQGRTGTLIDDFNTRAGKLTDPSLAKQTPPQLDPSSLGGVRAPQLSSALGATPGQAPQTHYAQALQGSSQQPQNAQLLQLLTTLLAGLQKPAGAASGDPAAGATRSTQPVARSTNVPPGPAPQAPAQSTQPPGTLDASGQNPTMKGADARGGYLIDSTGGKWYLENGTWVQGGTTTPPAPTVIAAPTAQPTFGGFRAVATPGSPTRRITADAVSGAPLNPFQSARQAAV